MAKRSKSKGKSKKGNSEYVQVAGFFRPKKKGSKGPKFIGYMQDREGKKGVVYANFTDLFKMMKKVDDPDAGLRLSLFKGESDNGPVYTLTAALNEQYEKEDDDDADDDDEEEDDDDDDDDDDD